jgi:hypothetical protein
MTPELLENLIIAFWVALVLAAAVARLFDISGYQAIAALDEEPAPPPPRPVVVSLYGVPVRELPPGFADELLRSGRIISQDVLEDDEWSAYHG